MSLDSNTIQAAVYAYLTDASICDGRVYDNPEQARTLEYPYIEFAGAVAVNGDDSTGDGLEWSLTLHVWSEAHGQKEANEISDLIRAALHRKAFTTSSDIDCICWFDSAQNLKADDGEGWQAVIRLRIVATT